MISARFELLTLELKETLSGAIRTGILSTTGAVLGLLGWIGVSVGLTLLIATALPGWAAALIVGGAELLIGGALVVIGPRLAHKPKLAISPEESQEVRRRLPAVVRRRPAVAQATGPAVYQSGG